jgi:arabinofuranosyltransferase
VPQAGVVLLPDGALVYAALPPAWDFATSGLENGVGLLWIACSWWLLCARVARRDPGATPSWWVPVVLSLGPLVRPDFAVFSVAFLCALLLLCERRLAVVGRVLALAAVVPVVTELARMAYYGDVVPNTAIAKEATSSNWAQGLAYLRDYVSSYVLLVPLVVLLAWWVLGARRSRGAWSAPDRLVGMVVVAGGIVHGLYITRVGGDFMHARMLLPTTFVILLPVSVMAVRGRQWYLVAVIASWAFVCGLWLRPPYSVALATGARAATAAVPYDRSTGIDDERLFWVRTAGTAHPVTLDDYRSHDVFARDGTRVAQWVATGRRGLLLDPRYSERSLVRLRRGVKARIIVSSGALGLFSYAAGDQVEVVDEYGLASPLAAHQRLVARGRPGHEKALSNAWLLAEYADPRAAVAPKVAPREVAAARRALACAPLRTLISDETRRLTPATAVDDLGVAWSASSFRFAPDPVAAAQQTCSS